MWARCGSSRGDALNGASRSFLAFPDICLAKAEFKDLRVEIEEGSVRVRFNVDGTQYELNQKLTRAVDPERSKHVVSGRKLSIELFKRRPSGWKRPFKGLEGKTPKWLKTDFDRWEDDLQLSDSSGDEGGDKGKAKPAAADKGADLRAALREVEERDKRDREERQRQLEESLKKGVKAPARDETVGEVDLDGID
jgi:hypothetical protein